MSRGSLLTVFLFAALTASACAWVFPPKAEYEFAKHFSMSDLKKPSQLDLFIRTAFYHEGFFHQDGIGVNITTGVTYDGHAIDPETGLPCSGGLHPFSAPSKEALHLMMIARALDGDERAMRFFFASTPGFTLGSTPSVADVRAHLLQLLEAKIRAYEIFDKNYPGYAGWLPWFHVEGLGIAPQPDWNYRVPSLDNGEWVWGLYACAHVLDDVGQHELAARYFTKLKQLATYAKKVFYQPDLHVFAAETRMADIYLEPSRNKYVNNVPGYVLDDPYEGELFVMFCDLFCSWDSQEERELVWTSRRKKLQPIEYQGITVQKGWWYSSHEQWKLLELPYTRAPYASQILRNSEVVRTLASLDRPGLGASVTGVQRECGDRGYVSDIGIAQLAFQPVTCHTIVTPYAASPVMLFNASVGVAWYANMINGTKGQGPCGSTEALNIDGTNISPVLTWDAKVNGILGMIGGIGEMNGNYLEFDGLLERFTSVIDREYRLAFPTVKGTDKQPVPPVVRLPNRGGFKE